MKRRTFLKSLGIAPVITTVPAIAMTKITNTIRVPDLNTFDGVNIVPYEFRSKNGKMIINNTGITLKN